MPGHAKKGDNISYFQFGSSDVVVVFEKVTLKSGLQLGETKLNVRSELARFQGRGGDIVLGIPSTKA